MGVPGGYPRIRGKALVCPHFAQFFHALPQLVRQRTLLGALFCVFPVKRTAVQVAAVVCPIGVGLIIPAVELGDLVAGVQHRKSLQKCHDAMQQQVTANRIVQRDHIARFQRLLYSAQAGGGAATAGIAGSGVVVVQLALCPASGEIARIKMVEILLVLLGVNIKTVLSRFIQTPADIIMAAQIVYKPAVARQGVQGVQLCLQQAGVAACQGSPQVDHGGYIVKHMAFRLFGCAKVRRQLLGRHDHFALEDDRGADTFQHHAQHPHNGMYLR